MLLYKCVSNLCIHDPYFYLKFVFQNQKIMFSEDWEWAVYNEQYSEMLNITNTIEMYIKFDNSC